MKRFISYLLVITMLLSMIAVGVVPTVAVDETPLDVYIGAADLAKSFMCSPKISTGKFSVDGQYTTFFALEDCSDGYIQPYSKGVKESGQYAVVKYK